MSTQSKPASQKPTSSSSPSTGGRQGGRQGTRRQEGGRQEGGRQEGGRGKPQGRQGPGAGTSGASQQSFNERNEAFKQKYKKEFDQLDAIQKEHNTLKSRRTAISTNIETLRKSIVEERNAKIPIRKALQDAIEVSKKIREQVKAAKDRREENKKMMQNKKAALEARAKEVLPFTFTRDPEFLKKNLDALSEQQAKLDRKIVEERLSSTEERATLSKISELEKKKVIARECEKIRLEIEASRGPLQISSGPASSSESGAPVIAGDERKVLAEKEAALKAQLDTHNKNIKDLEDKIAALLKQIDTIRTQTAALSEKWVAQQKVISDKKEHEKEANRIRQEKLKEERERTKEERTARLAQRKQELEERARQEALRLPYENELSIAKGLLPHLNSVKPSKSDSLTLPLRVYNSFEILSIAPPLSQSELPACLGKVNEKIAFYKAARSAEKKKRDQEAKAQPAAQPSQPTEASAPVPASSSTEEVPPQSEPVAAASD